MARPPLALVLLRASRWFDQRLREQLVADGWPALSAAQSLVFAHLDADGTSPAELARRLGTSRQSTSELVAGLVRLGLLTVQDDPARRRGRLVGLTRTGQQLADHAGQVLVDLEAALDGARVELVHRTLETLDRATDGSPPGEPPRAAHGGDR